MAKKKSAFDQLLADLKKSWPKTLALGVLLLVFGVVAVPPIMDAFGAGGPPQAKAATTAATAPAPTPAKPAEPDGPKLLSYHWKDHESVVTNDPLMGSVEQQFFVDPFEIDYAQFPPPIIFAQDDDEVLAEEEQRRKAREEAARKRSARPKTPTPQEKGFVLYSTVVGKRQRAAVVNKRMYREGADITHNGETYQLAAVFDRRVMLTRAGEAFELKLSKQNFRGIDVTKNESRVRYGLGSFSPAAPTGMSAKRISQPRRATRDGSTTPQSGTTRGGNE